MTTEKPSTEALLVLDTELSVRAANKSFYELFRLAPEECIGRKVYEIGGKGWDSNLRKVLESVLEGAPQSDHFELLHDPSEAGHGTLWITARLVPSADPREATILVAIQNLSANGSPEQALADKTGELHEFAGLAGQSAHELNNLLTVIRMNGELVLEMLRDARHSTSEMQDLLAAAERAEGLTKQVLVSSRRARPQPTGLDRETSLPLPGSPLKESKQDIQERASSLAESRRLRPPRDDVPHGRETILVVDDQEPLRKLALRVLAKAGYRVLEAKDGAHALRVAAEEVGELDLVLTDVEMPTLGGRGMVEELRELSPGMRVLFMSGYTDNEILMRGIDTAVTDFLRKPFTAGSLLLAVREALSKSARG